MSYLISIDLVEVLTIEQLIAIPLQLFPHTVVELVCWGPPCGRIDVVGLRSKYKENPQMKMNIRFSQKARRRNLLILSFILALIIIFLLYTSEDTRWGSGNWEKWLISHTHCGYPSANFIVNILRRTLHFLGYGVIGLLSWIYFYLWGFKKSLRYGLIFTAMIAMLDEYAQSLTTFRFGKPQDVLLDMIGAIVLTGLVKFHVRGNWYP